MHIVSTYASFNVDTVIICGYVYIYMVSLSPTVCLFLVLALDNLFTYTISVLWIRRYLS